MIDVILIQKLPAASAFNCVKLTTYDIDRRPLSRLNIIQESIANIIVYVIDLKINYTSYILASKITASIIFAVI